MKRADLLRYFPRCGECLLCGHRRRAEWDAMHRRVDIIRSRYKVGESIRSLALDYTLPRAAVQYVATAPLKDLDFLRRRK